ncbi:hypothetical protein [Aquimarina aquimarini]|uniref:hypothetical protein n=1 Tax=Aquimarina aquimarini TaxID=1191734 RepID=UPI00131F3113|nr:hypothetical protein [Aquimarina aquimarini]
MNKKDYKTLLFKTKTALSRIQNELINVSDNNKTPYRCIGNVVVKILFYKSISDQDQKSYMN